MYLRLPSAYILVGTSPKQCLLSQNMYFYSIFSR